MFLDFSQTFQGIKTRHADDPDFTCITHSSRWATGVCGIVRAACVVGGLTHGAYRPFLLLIRRHFGGRSKEKTQSMPRAYQQILSRKYRQPIYCMSNDLNERRRIGGSRLYCLPPIIPPKFKLYIMRCQHGPTNQANYSHHVTADTSLVL